MNDIDDIINQTMELTNHFVDALPVHKKDKNELRKSSLTLVSAYLSSDSQMSVLMKVNLFLQCLSDLKDDHNDLRYFFEDQDTAELISTKIVHSFAQDKYDLIKQVKTERKTTNAEEMIKKFTICVAHCLKGEKYYVFLCANSLSNDSDRFNTELFEKSAQKFIKDELPNNKISEHERYIIFLKDIMHQAQLCEQNIFTGLNQEQTIVIEEHATSTVVQQSAPKPLAMRRA